MKLFEALRQSSESNGDDYGSRISLPEYALVVLVVVLLVLVVVLVVVVASRLPLKRTPNGEARLLRVS